MEPEKQDVKIQDGIINQHDTILNCIIQRLNNLSVNKEKQKQKQPVSYVSYLQDWMNKLIRDGYNIERVLEILKTNSKQTTNKRWLQKFLGSYRTTLRKRNLRYRVCLPRMFINKSQQQVKCMLKQKYPVLANNQPALSYVMKTGYKWRNLKLNSIQQQLKRNRYEVKKICETIQNQNWSNSYEGLAWRSLQMKQTFHKCGECVYIVQHKAKIDLSSKSQSEKWRYVAIGIVISQFALPVIVFLVIYEIKCIYHLNNSQHMVQPGFVQIFQDLLVKKILSALISQWVGQNSKIKIILHYFYAEQQNIKEKNFAYISEIQNTEFSQNNRIKALRIILTNQQLKCNEDEFQSKSISEFIGIFYPTSAPLQAVYNLLNKAISNNNECPIPCIIRELKDLCELITCLIKISECLQLESLLMREPASEAIWNSSLEDEWGNSQLIKLRYALYSKYVFKIIINIFRDSVMYSVKQNHDAIDPKYQYIVQSSKNSKINSKLKMATIVYNIKNYRWQCQCNFIVLTGIPCFHIVALLRHLRVQIFQYINPRWKNDNSDINICKQIQEKEIKEAKEQRIPTTTNKGLIRLIQLYRQNCYGYLF